MTGMAKLTSKQRKEIGWRIKEIRELDLEMTQTQFAEKLGTTQATISRIEKGRALPSLEVLLKTAMISRKSTDWILNRNVKGSD